MNQPMTKMFCLVVFFLVAVVPIKAQVVTAYNVDNTILVDGSHFPCSDVGINNALAALPSSVGTVIVPGCQGILPLSSTVTVGPHQTLMLNQGTEVQPQSAGMVMFSVKAGGTLRGLWADASNQPTFQGQVISYTDNTTDFTHTTISDITCTGGPTSGPPATGSCIWFAAGSSNNVAFVTVTNVHVEGYYAGISLNSNGPGWINGNLFSNIHVSWAVIGYVFNGTAGGSISGNMFSNISYQCCGGQPESVGVLLEGPELVTQNFFSGLVIWDTTSPNVPIDIATSSIHGNMFQGKFSDGTVYDPDGQNQYLYSGSNTGGYAFTGIRSLALGPTVVSSLPPASSSPGLVMYVTDSTAISPGMEGQPCSGGSSNKALAFSNGIGWKCF